MLDQLKHSINNHADDYIRLSDEIWDHPETAYEEQYAAKHLSAYLAEQGFRIRFCNDIPTAFVAEYGNGSPIIGLLGEYDALPNLSQTADVQQRQEKTPNAPGHGCGHHLLGVGAAAAAIAVKEYLESREISGTVRFYGCPAEEYGSGKERMIHNGEFRDLDACLTWHPSSENYIVGTPYLANIIMKFRFHGKTSHAAASPELGRSALDACELMNVGVNYLREHVPSHTRMHYAYINSGGPSPNIVPEHAELLYYIRSSKISEARAVVDRVTNIAKGAALMTETECKSSVECTMWDYVPNHTLGKQLHTALQEVGAPEFTPQDMEYAAAYTSVPKELVLDASIADYLSSDICTSVSSDVGNVSHIAPTAQLYTCCFAKDTPFHSWQMTAQGKSSIAHKGMLTAATALALCAVRLIVNPSPLETAKAELSAYQ